jgi:hypothetical protein
MGKGYAAMERGCQQRGWGQSVEQVMAGLPYIKIYFKKTRIALKLNVFELDLNFNNNNNVYLSSKHR